MPVALSSVTVRQTAAPEGVAMRGGFEATRLASEPRYGVRDADGILSPLQITSQDNVAVLSDVSGTFSLVLRASGYQDFERSDVVVPMTRDGCYRPAQMISVEGLMTSISTATVLDGRE